MDERVKLVQGAFDSFRVRWSGSAPVIVIILLGAMLLNMCANGARMQVSNNLRKQQLEQARRQYSLDSLRFEYMRQHHK